jgi:hypothetical protein
VLHSGSHSLLKHARCAGLVRNIRGGTTIVFALGMAVLQYLYRHEPKSLGFAGTLLKLINGDEENPDKVDKVVRKQLGYKPGASTSRMTVLIGYITYILHF